MPFIDPMEDCPDKLIWALIGWLAWESNAENYRAALIELRDLINFALDRMKPEGETP